MSLQTNLRIFAFAAASVLLQSGALAQEGQPPAAEGKISGPAVKVDAEEHDFGTTWVGPPLNHTFTLTNVGTETLNISAVKPSCGCTAAGSWPRKIEPGQSGEFPFVVNSTKLHGDYSKAIRITTDDPRNSTLTLKLKGTVKQYVETNPRYVNFGRLDDQEPRESTIKLTNNTEKPLELSLNGQLPTGYQASINAVEEGKEFELTVKAMPPFEPGNIKETIKIGTNIPEQREIEVRMSGYVPKRLDVIPSTLYVTQTGTETRRPLTFTNNGSNPVKVLEATVDDPSVGVDVTERIAGKRYVISLTIPANHELAAAGNTVTIKTDDSSSPVLTVPLKMSKPRTPPTARNTPKERPPRPAELLAGQPAPSFSIKDKDGNEFSNSTIEGSVAVLDFFAVNCPHCKRQIPTVESIRKDYEKKGVKFYYVSQTMRKPYPNEEVAKTLADLGVTGELIFDPSNSIGPKFQATGFPTMVVVGKDGKIEAANVGNRADLKPTLTSQLDRLLEGKPALTDAERARLKKSTADAQPRRATPPRRPANDLLGQTAPEFAGKTVDGKELTDDVLEGKITLLNFFAPNCPHCKKQMPKLESIRKEFESKGVQFVNVSETMRKTYPAEEVQDLVKGLGARGELVYDPNNEIGGKYKASGYPTMFVIGKDKKVEAVHIGNAADLETKLKRQVENLIEGKPALTPAEARALTQTRDNAGANAAPAASGAEALVGKPLPDFRAKLIDGTRLKPDDLKESVTLLNFFAPNCPHCKKQIPRLEKIRKQYANKGVRVINISQTMRQPYSDDEIVKLVKEMGSHAELIADPQNTLGRDFGATTYPTLLVVGKDGKVDSVTKGNVADLESKVTTQLDSLLNGSAKN